MKTNELIAALRRMKVETGSLICFGCGHEHNCSTRGCALIREAADQLEQGTHKKRIAIDRQALIDLIIDAKRTDPETGSFTEWLADYLIEHLPELGQATKWISVEDRLPERCGQYLACCDDEGTPYGEGIWYQKDVVVCAEYGHGVWTWDEGTTEYDLTGIVTHWMELPAPPESRPPEGEANE